MKYVFPDSRKLAIQVTPRQLAYQHAKLQLVAPKAHAPLPTISLVAQTDLVYVFAGTAKPKAQHDNIGVHITQAMSLLRVVKKLPLANATSKPLACKQENAVASPNQNAARPGVPTASFIEHVVPLKHADTHALHVNSLVISEFAETAVVRNGVQLENAQLIINGELPKLVNAHVASGVEKLIM